MRERLKKFEKIPIRLTYWIGTASSLVAHTILFIAAFLLPYLGVISFTDMMLVLTTVVSLEAIYLAIFIQMTVTHNIESLKEVSEDVQEISEDVEELSENVDKIQEEERKDEIHEEKTKVTLEKIEVGLQKLLSDIETLKQQGLKP